MSDVLERRAPIKVRTRRLSHLGLPVRDVQTSCVFYRDVLGGEPMAAPENRARFRFGTFFVEVAPKAGGWTQPGAEYPHYGFTVEPDDYLPLIQRLRACGVPTHDPWTRHDDAETLMYFRDPSGNQFEMYCPKGFKGLALRRGDRAGGDFAIDFDALNYAELKDVAEAPPIRPGALAELNHMTIPVRDMQEMRRFLVEVLGGELVFALPDHITVSVGGAPVGFTDRLAALRPWTGPEVEYPLYGFLINGADLQAMQDQIQAADVPTSHIWTRDGVAAHLTFRDPSGNVFELIAPTGFPAVSQLPRRTPKGDEELDLKALSYDRWNDTEIE